MKWKQTCEGYQNFLRLFVGVQKVIKFENNPDTTYIGLKSMSAYFDERYMRKASLNERPQQVSKQTMLNKLHHMFFSSLYPT